MSSVYAGPFFGDQIHAVHDRIDEQNVVLAGNGVTEAAAEAGITKVRVVEASGNEIIAVRRRGLSDEQKRALAIYDNRTAELAEWNPEQLKADQAAGLSLEPWFTEREQTVVLGEKGARDEEASTDELGSQYLVVITCPNEQEQVRLLERFSTEGLECKALVS